ncbi:MAG: glycosyltransferase family 9 protein, partial [Candidatus Zixiibacteriota bacterium]
DLIHREWTMHMLAGTIEKDDKPDRRVFQIIPPPLFERKYDVVIHPGASKPIRAWPDEYYEEFVRLLGDTVRIAFLGTPADLSVMQARLGTSENVEFLSGHITDAVETVASAKCVVTMDSGFSHVAAFLGVDHLALFGPTDPSMTPPISSRSEVLWQRKLTCQPCNRHHCMYDVNYCMRLITPGQVAEKIHGLLAYQSSSVTSGSQATL